MNDQELKSLWKSQPLDAEAVSPETIRGMAEGLHATLLRRNSLEKWAGYLVILIFGLFAWIQETTTMRTGCVLMVVGTLVMLYQLRRRASVSALPVQGVGRSYVDYVRAELIHQRDAARSIWLWYIAPAVPGFAVLVWGMAENNPLEFPWLPVVAMFVVPLGVVLFMNLNVARKMQQKIDEIDASVI